MDQVTSRLPVTRLNEKLGFGFVAQSPLSMKTSKWRKARELKDVGEVKDTGSPKASTHELSEEFLVRDGFGNIFWPNDGVDPKNFHKKDSNPEGKPLRFSDDEDKVL